MKSLAVSIVLALGVSAPALAQQAVNPPADSTATQPAAGEPNLDEILIDDATTPEGRMAMLLRCSGPPPKPIASTAPAKEAPASEPATVAERAAAPTGG
jgi:hypothetical protein